MKEISKKMKMKKVILYTFYSLIFSGLLFVLTLLFFEGTEFKDIMDSLLVTGVLVFFIGWMIYVTNAGIFSLVAYGTQRFFAALLKRRYRTYEDMVYNRSKVDILVIISICLAGLIVLMITTAMYIYYYKVIIA